MQAAVTWLQSPRLSAGLQFEGALDLTPGSSTSLCREPRAVTYILRLGSFVCQAQGLEDLLQKLVVGHYSRAHSRVARPVRCGGNGKRPSRPGAGRDAVSAADAHTSAQRPGVLYRRREGVCLQLHPQGCGQGRAFCPL